MLYQTDCSREGPEHGKKSAGRASSLCRAPGCLSPHLPGDGSCSRQPLPFSQSCAVVVMRTSKINEQLRLSPGKLQPLGLDVAMVALSSYP